MINCRDRRVRKPEQHQIESISNYHYQLQRYNNEMWLVSLNVEWKCRQITASNRRGFHFRSAETNELMTNRQRGMPYIVIRQNKNKNIFCDPADVGPGERKLNFSDLETATFIRVSTSARGAHNKQRKYLCCVCPSSVDVARPPTEPLFYLTQKQCRCGNCVCVCVTFTIQSFSLDKRPGTRKMKTLKLRFNSFRLDSGAGFACGFAIVSRFLIYFPRSRSVFGRHKNFRVDDAFRAEKEVCCIN